jgi:hypothetical protein
MSAAAVVQIREEVRQEAAPEKVKFPAILTSPVQFKSCVWERHNPEGHGPNYPCFRGFSLFLPAGIQAGQLVTFKIPSAS